MYIGSAGVVAAALIIYLGIFAPSPTGDDVTGTINTVQKYQTDQMSDTDVILEGEELIIDEMAALYEHATVEEQADMLGKATQEMTISILGRCDKKIHASIWGRMEKSEQVAAFNAMNREKESLLGRAEMTMGSFNRMSLDQQAVALQGLLLKRRPSCSSVLPKRPRWPPLAAWICKAAPQSCRVRM